MGCVVNEAVLLGLVTGAADLQHARGDQRRQIGSDVHGLAGLGRVVLPDVLNLTQHGGRQVPVEPCGPQDRFDVSRGQQIDQAAGIDGAVGS